MPRKKSQKRASVTLRYEPDLGLVTHKKGAYFSCLAPLRRHFKLLAARLDSADPMFVPGYRIRFEVARPADVPSPSAFRPWIVTSANLQGIGSPESDRLLRRLGVKNGDPVAWRVVAAR